MNKYKIVTIAAFTATLVGMPFAFAQVATTLEQAELAGLSPQKRELTSGKIDIIHFDTTTLSIKD